MKYNADKSKERYKACLGIQGDNQEEGFDFTETHGPDAKVTSLRCFLLLQLLEVGNYIK